MKKYFIFVLIFAVLLLGYNYLVYYEGVYLNFFRDEVEIEVPFKTEGMEFQIQKENGEYETIVFQGVDISASMPGSPATLFNAEEEDYLRWFTMIGEMGANLLRVTTVMDDNFYNALYEYNTTNQNVLYLLQGSGVSDRANDGPEDGYSEDFFEELVSDGRDLVDIIHGRKTISVNDRKGSGRYRKDVSQWVIGYLVGADWNSGTVAYTDNRTIYSDGYQGTYFQTTDDCTNFEAMLCEVMDKITTYETAKYNTQRPIGFINTPTCDFLEYGEVYARQLGKYVQIDPEHVIATEQMLAGQYAAYRVYDFCDAFLQCLSEEQALELQDVLSTISEDDLYGGYLKLVVEHHTMPVMIASYGFSTARNPAKKDELPITETEQGERLMAVYEEAMECGWIGVCISTWQDYWELTTWNVAFGTVVANNYLWHDLQCDNQNYGLMAFESGEGIACIVDGNTEEWLESNIILKQNDMTLSIRYDAEAIYLLITGVTEDDEIYIPIDSTPETGSQICDLLGLTFSRAVDFVLRIDGRDNSQLFVQERYNAMEENFGWETTFRDPFIYPPEADTSVFSEVTLAIANDYLLNEDEWLLFTPQQKLEAKLLGIWNTGKLVFGSHDKESEYYNTLADMSFGENCVELRLPWGLLNVGDPSENKIHQDYYENYGVEMRDCDGIYFGMIEDGQSGSTKDEMGIFEWEGWNDVWSRERLKDSYYVIQEVWR